MRLYRALYSLVCVMQVLTILLNAKAYKLCFCPYRARLLQHEGTQGVASLALG